MTYEDVAKWGKFIARVTQSCYMPPFPADRRFQHYANGRGLSDAEINAIQTWVTGGMAHSDSIKTANPTVAKARSFRRKTRPPDLVLRMKPYAIQGNGREDFRYFHVPMNLAQDIWVEAIEFVPGNRKLVHHNRLMVDSTGTMASIQGITEDDPKLRDFQRTPLADEFLYGWVPCYLPARHGQVHSGRQRPIADWDYNWQLTYFFRDRLVPPKGSTLIAEARYDNTDQSPLNPNRPARTVGYGWNSTDEMMNLVVYYVKQATPPGTPQRLFAPW